jgi:hypothetical protein
MRPPRLGTLNVTFRPAKSSVADTARWLIDQGHLDIA